MLYKSLQQLRDESKMHSDRALELVEEAKEIFLQMKDAISVEDYTKLQKRWLKKDEEARAAIQKSIEIRNQVIQELERLKNRNLN